MTPGDVTPLELARRYHAEGYNASVVARKLISQHGVAEAEATAMASELFGTTVDPRAGETTVEVLTGLAIAAAGVLVGVLTVWLVSDWLFWGFCAAVTLVGAGAKRVFFALVNARAKEDLRGRRD